MINTNINININVNEDILRDETMAAPKCLLDMFIDTAERLDICRKYKVGDLVMPDRTIAKMAKHRFKDEDIILKVTGVNNNAAFQEVFLETLDGKASTYGHAFEFTPATFADGVRLLHDTKSTFIEVLGVTSPYSLEKIYDGAAKKSALYENIFNDNGIKYISLFYGVANVWLDLEKGIRRYLDFNHFMEYVCAAVIEQLYPSLDEFLENWLMMVNLAKQVNRPVNLYCENVDIAIRVLRKKLMNM